MCGVSLWRLTLNSSCVNPSLPVYHPKRPKSNHQQSHLEDPGRAGSDPLRLLALVLLPPLTDTRLHPTRGKVDVLLLGLGQRDDRIAVLILLRWGLRQLLGLSLEAVADGGHENASLLILAAPVPLQAFLLALAVLLTVASILYFDILGDIEAIPVAIVPVFEVLGLADVVKGP